MSKLTCERCVAPCEYGVRCDPCMIVLINGLLDSPHWVTWRGCAAGDLPGETMADTMRRELRLLQNK